jgi:hypothetical protein
MSSTAVFEKLPAIPRAPTKLRGFHRETPQQRGSQPIIATTKAIGQVLSIKASALYRYDSKYNTLQPPRLVPLLTQVSLVVILLERPCFNINLKIVPPVRLVQTP